MKISLIVSNLATNCIVRTWPIARALERLYPIEIIGSLWEGEDMFACYEGELPCTVVRWRRGAPVMAGMRRVAAAVTGDVVYAFKPLAASLGAALLARRRRGCPVVLDVEDWEAWKLGVGAGWRRLARLALHLVGPGWRHPHSLKFRWVFERLASRADGVTVVSRFLQRRFGGVRLPHGADTDVFDPCRFDPAALRSAWGLDPRWRLVLFAGTPAPHKGVEDLLQAVLSLPERAQCRLLMVGRRPARHRFTRTLLDRGQGRVVHIGSQPHERMPELLAAADLVAVPQRLTPVAEAQVPGKIFEAMAMGKPIIGTAVSDVPEILEGCGLVVPPGDVPALSAALQRLLDEPECAAALGRAARERAIERYSWQAMTRILQGVFEPLGREYPVVPPGAADPSGRRQVAAA